jgi:tetrahydromethanopterin S-methyltransferase subunit G
MSEEIVKIAVLEQKLIDFANIVSKLDSAIEKLSEVNTNITKMLAVHEERIEQCNKSDNLLIKMIEDLKHENEKDHEEVTSRIDNLEVKVEEIAKIKWMTVGTGVMLAVLATAFSTLASGWWTPSEMQMQKQGHIHQSTDIQK